MPPGGHPRTKSDQQTEFQDTGTVKSTDYMMAHLSDLQGYILLKYLELIKQDNKINVFMPD